MAQDCIRNWNGRNRIYNKTIWPWVYLFDRNHTTVLWVFRFRKNITGNLSEHSGFPAIQSWVTLFIDVLFCLDPRQKSEHTTHMHIFSPCLTVPTDFCLGLFRCLSGRLGYSAVNAQILYINRSGSISSRKRLKSIIVFHKNTRSPTWSNITSSSCFYFILRVDEIGRNGEMGRIWDGNISYASGICWRWINMFWSVFGSLHCSERFKYCWMRLWKSACYLLIKWINSIITNIW